VADDVQLLDETSMRDAELDHGLYAKFEVRRTDAEAQARHAGCRVFVLGVNDDPHAAWALLAYAQACEETQPNLTADLCRLVGHHLGASPALPPSSRPCLISTAKARHALQLLELQPAAEKVQLTQRYAHTVVEQEKRMSIARQIASAKLADLDGYVHGEECATYYEGECDCGHDGLANALRDLVRVLGDRPRRDRDWRTSRGWWHEPTDAAGRLHRHLSGADPAPAVALPAPARSCSPAAQDRSSTTSAVCGAVPPARNETTGARRMPGSPKRSVTSLTRSSTRDGPSESAASR